MKKIENKNGKIELINASDYLQKTILYNTLPYIVSDSENSLARINEYYFALATITSYQNSHLIITTLNIYNEDNSLVVDYFVFKHQLADLSGCFNSRFSGLYACNIVDNKIHKRFKIICFN